MAVVNRVRPWPALPALIETPSLVWLLDIRPFLARLIQISLLSLVVFLDKEKNRLPVSYRHDRLSQESSGSPAG